MWAVASLLPSIYDYAGACNAINPVLHEGPRVQIAIAPPLPVGEGYRSFVWRIHIRDITKLWDDTTILKVGSCGSGELFIAFAFLFTASVSCEGGEKRITAKNKRPKVPF